MYIFGQAIADYFYDENPEDIRTETSISSEDILPVDYLFRTYEDMPLIEQKALEEARGKVLDVGCAAGSHSLYLQEKGLEVDAIDISKKATEVAAERGLKNTYHTSLLDWDKEKYDTIILLMNGTGIFERFERVPVYLNHLKKLLKPGGQILIDSSDIAYMYDEEELQALYSFKQYYGELEFTIRYKDLENEEFPWLYLDPTTFKKIAEIHGFKFEIIQEGEHFDYLAKLSL